MTYTALRVDDSVNTCDCCGRTDLKATVLMQDIETGALVNFGRVCATRNSGKDQRRLKQEMIQAFNDNVGRASNALRFSEEARALRLYRLTAPWKTLGWDAYNTSSQVTAFEALKARLALRYGVPITSF